MKKGSRLLEKHHQYLKKANIESSETTPTQQATTTPTQNVNPFARQTATEGGNKDQMVNENVIPATSTSQFTTSTVDVSKLQAYNSNPDFVRLTTGVFPQISGYNSVAFPLAAFIKPLGLSVS